MTHTSTINRMPTRSKYVSTETPQARERVTAAVLADFAAVEAARRSLEERDRVIREEYAGGVEPRDLVAICRDAGWARVTRQQITTIGKAEPRPPRIGRQVAPPKP